MRKTTLLALGLFLPVTASAQQTLSLDLWTGTLESSELGSSEQQLSLKRCDVAQHRYLLVNDKQPEDNALNRLNTLLKETTGPLTVTVVAAYQEQGGTHALIVEDIADFQEGSCHLLDLLEAIPLPADS